MFEATADLEVCGEAPNRETMLTILNMAEPDAAIVDISLGDKQSSGLELIPLLQARLGKSFPVLVYSMHDEMMYAERALSAGARGYLMKQEPVRRIIEAIRTVLDGKIFLSNQASQVMLSAHVRGYEKPHEARVVENLSPREFEVFCLLGKGLPPREIARQLFLSVKTVETHRAKIREKLGLASALEVTHFAVQWVHRESQ
jgi:DNA-binding NarL/FixJ family response regulator